MSMRGAVAAILDDRIVCVGNEVDDNLQQLVAIRPHDWQVADIAGDSHSLEILTLQSQGRFQQLADINLVMGTAHPRERLLCLNDLAQVLNMPADRVEILLGGIDVGLEPHGEAGEILRHVPAPVIRCQELRQGAAILLEHGGNLTHAMNLPCLEAHLCGG